MTGRGTAPPRPARVLLALSSGRFCMGLQLQTIASLTPFLMADLGFSYSQIGLLIGLFLAPGVLLALPGSVLIARFGHLGIGVTGVVLMAAGSLWLALADGFAGAMAARLVSGTGAILMNIAFLRLVARLFEGKAMNSAISIVMSAWPVGLGLAAVSYPLLAETAGWRQPLWILTAVTVGAAVLGLAFVREPARPATAAVPRPSSLFRLDARSRWLSFTLGAAFACFTAGGILFLSFAPPLLIERGMTLAGASAATSLIVWLGLVGTPLGGWAADRLGSARGVILGGSLASALLVAGVLLDLAPTVLTLLLGIAWGAPAAPFSGLLQRTLPEADLGTGYGIYFTLFYAGFFAFPAMGGWLVDATGSAAAPLWLAVALLLASAALILVFYALARALRPDADAAD